MEDKQMIAFSMYEMEYKGGVVKADASLTAFDEKYYEQYKVLVDDCYYEMRKALNIQPCDKHSIALEELPQLKECTFLLLNGDEIIGAVTCSPNEIGSVAVNTKYQRQGYGRKMIVFAISYMQRRGDAPIKLIVTKWNKNAIALYESLRFEITKEATVEGVNTRDAEGNWSFEVTADGGLGIR